MLTCTMLKVCTICKKKKPLSEFNKNKSRKDGLNNLCKICSQQRSKLYYQENRKSHLKVIKNNKAKRVKGNIELLLEYLKQHSCIDCGNDDIRVLEFDHLSDKFKNVCKLVQDGYSWKTVQKEIAKCEVVCCNCHRIRSLERLGSYRHIEFIGLQALK